MPISNHQDAMDADIKSLRIDRSAKQKNGPGRGLLRWLLVSFGLSVLLGVAFVIYGRLNAALEVETVRVRTASTASPGAPAGATILNATGYIVTAHKIELASKVSGRVAWIGVEKGDKVKKGQVLVRLEDEEFRARVTEAQGQLNSLKARLAALENGSRPEETARSQADLENARVTLNRTRSMVEHGVMSRQTLDDAQARYDAQVAKFASYEKTNALVRIGPRREDIDAARAQVKQAEGTLAFAQSQFDNTVITAPISGAILERNVERGEFVTTGFVS